jgi:sugar phosphate isomerase/epimerase
MIEIAVASDNFRHEDRSVSYVFNWCRKVGCGIVEINTVNGEDFFEGLGFSPAISLGCDGVALRRELEQYGHLREALVVARTHHIGINIEPHGPLTTNLGLMVRLMKEINDPLLGVNFDTGNTFVSGNDPVAMVKELLPWIKHFHVKDVAPELRANIGKDTGIAASEVYVGQGINADNIRKIVDILKANRWSGVMSLETKGEANSAKSLEWLRGIVGKE